MAFDLIDRLLGRKPNHTTRGLPFYLDNYEFVGIEWDDNTVALPEGRRAAKFADVCAIADYAKRAADPLPEIDPGMLRATPSTRLGDPCSPPVLRSQTWVDAAPLYQPECEVPEPWAPGVLGPNAGRACKRTLNLTPYEDLRVCCPHCNKSFTVDLP